MNIANVNVAGKGPGRCEASSCCYAVKAGRVLCGEARPRSQTRTRRECPVYRPLPPVLRGERVITPPSPRYSGEWVGVRGEEGVQRYAPSPPPLSPGVAEGEGLR